MSRDAVRFGRVPKREKAKILAAMQSSKAKVLESRVLTEMADDRKMIDTIVRAHYDTCDYTVDKIKPFLKRAHENPKLSQCSGQRCPMKGSPDMSFLDQFSDTFMDHVRQVCTFAKLIPGFKCLQHEDQVTLLKSCVFEVLTVRLSGLFDNQSLVCLNGDVIRRETISAMPAGNAKFLMDNVFELTQRINRFNLSDAEIGLFCAVVIISADRPGLRNPELVGRMQNKLKNILQSIIVPQHPHQSSIFTQLINICQDLRTLNTLHTEKFLQQAKVMRDEVGGGLAASPVPSGTSSCSSSHHAGIVSQVYSDRDAWEDTASMDRDSTGSRSPQSSSDSPATSHSFSMEDLRRSPLGSVSSSESIANSETFSKLSVNDLKIHGSVLLNALTSPALSQQLGGGSLTNLAGTTATTTTTTTQQSSRKRELSQGDSATRNQPEETNNSGSGSQDATKCPYKARKLDSPSDSGIDSPKAQGSHSTNTSVCSSPRSSMEENQGGEEPDRQDLEEQHPLLKRALQQPPQPFNMGSVSNFQDEVYKPHKKFRHHDRKDGDEPTSTQDSGAGSPSAPGGSSSLVHSHSILASQLAAPPTWRRSSPPPPSGVSSSESMLTLSQGTAASATITTSNQSALCSQLSRPVLARAKRDVEKFEELENLIFDSGRYRPNVKSQQQQSLLMCATPLPAHTSSDRPWSPARSPAAATGGATTPQQQQTSGGGGGRHIPVPVAPSSHSTSSLSSSRSGGGGTVAAAAASCGQKKLRDILSSVECAPLNLSVRSPPASPALAIKQEQDTQ